MTIDYAALAEAARQSDNEVKTQGMPQWLEQKGIGVRDFVRAAHQRCLRAAVLLIDKPDLRPDFEAGFNAIRLSEAAEAMLPVLKAVWMDGFAVGLGVKKDEDNKEE